MKLTIEIKPVGNTNPSSVRDFLERITKKLYFTFQSELRGTIDETNWMSDCYIKTKKGFSPVHEAMLTTFNGTWNNDYFTICAVLAKMINTKENKNMIEFGVRSTVDEIVDTYISVKDNTEGYLAIQKLYQWLEKHDLDSIKISL